MSNNFFCVPFHIRVTETQTCSKRLNCDLCGIEWAIRGCKSLKMHHMVVFEFDANIPCVNERSNTTTSLQQ